MLQPKEKRFCLYLSKDDRTSREPFVPQIPGFFQKSRGSSTLRAGGAIAYNRNRFCTHPAKTMQEIEVTGTIDQQGHRVCKVVCVKGEISQRKSTFKFNRKAIESGFPISNRHCPFFRDIGDRQINHFHRGFVRGERTMIS